MTNGANALALDPSSTSPNFGTCAVPPVYEKCTYATIYFAYQIEGKTYGVSQGCCNHWDCPRCGQIRAKQEYARIVFGIHTLSKSHKDLYFQTITCRGKEMLQSEADAGYLSWTNRLLDSYRARVKKNGGYWAYVQVTERQKRGHPHSHFLTTFEPGDLADRTVTKWQTIAGEKTAVEKVVLGSEWLGMACVRSGLGDQYDISQVRDEAAASRYVAKYMFKQTAFSSDWPKGWKRVRYSQTFPKLPEIRTSAFALTSDEDWQKLGKAAMVVRVSDEDTEDYVLWRMRGSDLMVSRRKSDKERYQKVL